VLVSNHGCDTHHLDPLTHLSLSTRAFSQQAHLVHELAHAHTDGRWLAVGSGGYEWVDVVPRSWAILWSEMACRALPEQVPDSWVEGWQAHAERPLETRFLASNASETEYAEVTRANAETLSVVRSHFNIPSVTTS
jgi:acetoin utilization protein AcuC